MLIETKLASCFFILFKFWPSSSKFSEKKVRFDLPYCPIQSFKLSRKVFFCIVDKTSLDTVQKFLIKLGIKPRLHILKINIFSLNHAIHCQTYQSYEQPPQSLQNLYFQSHFSESKINPIFPFFFLWRIFG